MLRAALAIVALCVIYGAWLIRRIDQHHERIGDPRRASRRAVLGLKVVGLAGILLFVWSAVAMARPSPYPGVTQFNGDRYGSAQLGTEVARSVRCPPPACQSGRAARQKWHRGARKATGARQKWRLVPIPAPRPLAYEPYRVEEPISIGAGVQREAIEAVPTRWLVGVVSPLAAKAREIVAACGSKVISGVRHTYVAGTGGRLSLHASGRAVDIKGNPGCIYAQLRGWPGGYSTDYARKSIQHVHISYAPNGPEWGRRFAHYRGGHRHRHKHPRRRA